MFNKTLTSLIIISVFVLCCGYTDLPTTLGPPTTTTECSSGHTKVEHCRAFYCYNNQWQRFEFTATEECCKSEYHPMCVYMGFTQEPVVG